MSLPVTAPPPQAPPAPHEPPLSASLAAAPASAAAERPLFNSGYLEGVLRSLSSLTWASARASLAAAPHESCARTAGGWAALVGGLVGAHRLKQGGGPAAVARAAAAAAGFTFLTQFFLCRQQEFDTKVAMRLFVQRSAERDRAGGLA